jgi:hypothetical protein
VEKRGALYVWIAGKDAIMAGIKRWQIKANW